VTIHPAYGGGDLRYRDPTPLYLEVARRLELPRPGIHTQIRDHVLADVVDLIGQLDDGVLGCSPSLRYNALVHRVVQIRRPDPYAGWFAARMEVARSGVWWWPHQRACVVCERPSAVHRDARGRLHHARERALRYRDGYGLYLWHGTRVPKDWITAPEKLDPACALTWPGAEQRRAAGEIVGWQRVLDRCGARTVDRDADPQIGELVEVTPPGDAAARFLRVRCGTGRSFVLSVPREMRTARQANAWTYGLEANQYQPEVRT
jgi:hypothetical protein